MLLVAAVGLAMAALTANSASLMQLLGAQAAALGGFMILNWPKLRFPISSVLILGTAATVLALATQSLLYTRGDPLVLAPLVFVFLCDMVARTVGFGRSPTLRPIVLAACCLVPAGIAIVLAFLLNGDAYVG